MSNHYKNHEKLRKILSERIKEARNAKGLTQPELAEIIQSTDRNISNYETGYSYPSIEVLYKISQGLSTSIDYLFGLTDNPIIAKEPNTAELTNEDYRLFDQLKSDEDLYSFLAKKPETRVKYIYKIWSIMDEWERLE